MRAFLLTKTLFIGIYIRISGAVFFARLDLSGVSGVSGVSGAGRGECSFLENLRLFSFAGVLKRYLLHAVL